MSLPAALEVRVHDQMLVLLSGLRQGSTGWHSAPTKKVKRKEEDRLPLFASSVCFSDSDVQSSPGLHLLRPPLLSSQGPGLSTGALTCKLENLYVFKQYLQN